MPAHLVALLIVAMAMAGGLADSRMARMAFWMSEQMRRRMRASGAVYAVSLISCHSREAGFSVSKRAPATTETDRRPRNRAACVVSANSRISR